MYYVSEKVIKSNNQIIDNRKSNESNEILYFHVMFKTRRL